CAEISFKPERPGSYEVEAWAKDDQGNPVYDEYSFRVEKEREEEEEGRWLSLERDKDSYAPGDVALLRTKTDDMVGCWMLVTVEGERLFDHVVHKLYSSEFDLKIPIKEEYKPNVRVAATIIREGESASDDITLMVPHTEKQLEIIIAPDKEVYAPGEKARYSIVTRDSGGAGVAAEVGLGVVDESVYAILEDDTPHPYGVFWSRRRPRVTTDFSHASLYPGGGAQGGDGGPIAVRREFPDTAYWAPFLVTGPDGSAQ
ncbi:unnamed protein product, partial [marine sediment metagenome]